MRQLNMRWRKQIMSVKGFQILKHSTTACATYIQDVKVITATTILMTFAR